MDMKHWWDAATKEQRQALADACNVKAIYLYQIAIGFRQPSPILARAIETGTGGQVTKERLRPDVYGDAEAAA